MRSPPDPCPPGEDLTAYAHGEGDGATRARLARHLLACAACRATHASASEMFVALAAVGAARSVPARATPLARTRRWAAWLPPTAAAALIAAALLLPVGPGDEALPDDRAQPPPVASASHARVAPLLGAQAPDGHWAAEAGPLGAQPCAATAIVLLALLHERDAAQGALEGDPAFAWALERGTGYLLARLERPDRSLLDLAASERAVLLAALARASRATPSARLDTQARALVNDLRQRVATSPPDPASLPWLDYALAAAEEAGIPGASTARRSLDAAGPQAAWRAQAPARFPAGLPAEAPVCTPVRSALELLRDEPPLRLLALGPACRAARAPTQR